MKNTYSFSYIHHDSIQAMSQQDAMLLDKARGACNSSYSPYSGFKVGAAAVLASGKVLVASNQESEVFPAGICAEQNLLVHWQTTHAADPIVAIAIASISILDARECYPCGICRQAMVDTERRQGVPMRVIMCGVGGATIVESAKNLLPFQFEL